MLKTAAESLIAFVVTFTTAHRIRDGLNMTDDPKRVHAAMMKVLDEHTVLRRRVGELLGTTNRYLARARRAEAVLAELAAMEPADFMEDEGDADGIPSLIMAAREIVPWAAPPKREPPKPRTCKFCDGSKRWKGGTCICAAPVDTGSLRGSIHTYATKSAADVARTVQMAATLTAMDLGKKS